jgi:hypothetical protein
MRDSSSSISVLSGSSADPQALKLRLAIHVLRRLREVPGPAESDYDYWGARRHWMGLLMTLAPYMTAEEVQDMERTALAIGAHRPPTPAARTAASFGVIIRRGAYREYRAADGCVYRTPDAPLAELPMAAGELVELADGTRFAWPRRKPRVRQDWLDGIAAAMGLETPEPAPETSTDFGE